MKRRSILNAKKRARRRQIRGLRKAFVQGKLFRSWDLSFTEPSPILAYVQGPNFVICNDVDGCQMQVEFHGARRRKRIPAAKKRTRRYRRMLAKAIIWNPHARYNLAEGEELTSGQ